MFCRANGVALAMKTSTLYTVERWMALKLRRVRIAWSTRSRSM